VQVHEVGPAVAVHVAGQQLGIQRGLRSAKEVEARAYHHGRERAAAVGVVGEQGVNATRSLLARPGERPKATVTRPVGLCPVA